MNDPKEKPISPKETTNPPTSQPMIIMPTHARAIGCIVNCHRLTYLLVYLLISTDFNQYFAYFAEIVIVAENLNDLPISTVAEFHSRNNKDNLAIVRCTTHLGVTLLTWFQLALVGITHLLLANTNIGILGVCELVTRQIFGQLQAKYIEEKLTSSHHFCRSSRRN